MVKGAGMKLSKRKYDYSVLCKKYEEQEEVIKELEIRASSLYLKLKQREKELKELKELYRYRDKKLKDLELINAVMFKKLCEGVKKK